jgi:hypothetical protein
MRAIGPAGWSSHGFFGFRAKTFGNPGGATSGDGYFVNGQGGSVAPITFVRRATPTTHPIFALASDAAGNALLVDNTGAVFKSTDGGHTWSSLGAIAGFAPVQPLGYLMTAGGTWILSAVGGGNDLYRSTNIGASWTPITTGIVSDSGLAIGTNGAGTWFAVGAVNPAAPANYGLSSNDGVTWASAGVNSTGGTAAQYPVIWDGAQWVLFSSDPTGSFGDIWTSPDGLNWTANEMDFANGFLGGALFVGGNYYTGQRNQNNLFNGNSVTALTTATPINAPGIVDVQIIVQDLHTTVFFAMDSEGNVANTGAAGFGAWAQGNLNFATAGAACNAACYDSVHQSVIAGGADGSVCTVP